MKRVSEFEEGEIAFKRFCRAVQTVLQVPKNVVPPRPKRREKKTVKKKV